MQIIEMISIWMLPLYTENEVNVALALWTISNKGNWKCNLNNIALPFSEGILITKKVFNFFIVEDRLSASLCKVKNGIGSRFKGRV